MRERIKKKRVLQKNRPIEHEEREWQYKGLSIFYFSQMNSISRYACFFRSYMI